MKEITSNLPVLLIHFMAVELEAPREVEPALVLDVSVLAMTEYDLWCQVIC